jgi:hypothetical protein
MTARRFAGMLAISALHGPTPANDAIAYCEEVLARAAEDRKASAITEVALAHLEAMRATSRSPGSAAGGRGREADADRHLLLGDLVKVGRFVGPDEGFRTLS